MDGDGEQVATQVLWVLVGFKGCLELLDSLLVVFLLRLQRLLLVLLLFFVRMQAIQEEMELLKCMISTLHHFLGCGIHILSDALVGVTT